MSGDEVESDGRRRDGGGTEPQWSLTEVLGHPDTQWHFAGTTAVVGMVGVAVGLFVFGMAHLGQPTFVDTETTLESSDLNDYKVTLVRLSVYILPLVVIAAGTVVGTFVGAFAADEGVAVALSAAGTLLGSVVAVLVGVYLASLALPSGSYYGYLVVQWPQVVLTAFLTAGVAAVGAGLAGAVGNRIATGG